MSAPISCQDALDRLWGYLDDELVRSDRHVLERHVAWCVSCCGELEFARELRGFLADRGRPSVPGDVLARLEGFVATLPDIAEPTDNDARGMPWRAT